MSDLTQVHLVQFYFPYEVCPERMRRWLSLQTHVHRPRHVVHVRVVSVQQPVASLTKLWRFEDLRRVNSHRTVTTHAEAGDWKIGILRLFTSIPSSSHDGLRVTLQFRKKV